MKERKGRAKCATTNKTVDFHSSEQNKNLIDSKNPENFFRKLNAPAELSKHRTEEHQVQWGGLKSNFEPNILYFSNHKPGHVTTLKIPN